MKGTTIQAGTIQKTRRTGMLVGSKLKSEGSHNRPQLNARENGALESSSASFLFYFFFLFLKNKIPLSVVLCESVTGEFYVLYIDEKENYFKS